MVLLLTLNIGVVSRASVTALLTNNEHLNLIRQTYLLVDLVDDLHLKKACAWFISLNLSHP